MRSASSACPERTVSVTSLASRASRPASADASTWSRMARSCTSSRECPSRCEPRRAPSRSAVAVAAPSRSRYSIRPSTRCRSSDSQKAGSRASSSASTFAESHARARSATPVSSLRRNAASASEPSGSSATRASVSSPPGTGTAVTVTSASGSTNATSSPAPSRAVMKRNWSPSGNWRSTIAVAIRVSTCCSTARLSGRAPSSALNPCSIRKSTAASSHSTAHGRIRKPRRPSTSVSSFSSSPRMISRPSGRKTTTRSRRLRNSGLNERATDLTTSEASNLPARPAKPTPGPRGIAEPRFEVRMITQWRRSTVRPLRSVKRPSSKTWRKTSQICACAFSNSSSRRTENGCLRTCAISGAASSCLVASPRSRSRLSGVWYSLMSRRRSRSSEPKTKALNAFAISVLPVPVGPTKRKTPSGRVGSVSPAFTSAIRSTRHSTASG